MNQSLKKIITASGVLTVSLIITVLLIASRKAPQRKPNFDTRPTISTIEVNNDNIQLQVAVIGKLTAREHVQISAEVSGVLETTPKSFLDGTTYRQGEPMLQIRSEEAALGLMAQRSNLLMKIAQLLPDLKFDHPESYALWEKYLNQYQIDQAIEPLPEPGGDREKLFVAGRGIYQAYYEIKVQETRLSKYTLYAPFDGIVIQSNIKPGTLVMNGQKLGEFINTDFYDLETQVSVEEIGYVALGDMVNLSDGNRAAEWTGTVTRIGSSLDPASQMLNVYVTVAGADLKVGQYLQGSINTSTVVLAVEIPRKIITNANSVLMVADDTIHERSVNIIAVRGNVAFVTGLENGMNLSTKTQNLYDGLQVKTL